MEILGAFVDGMALALTPENLFYLFIGVLFGNIVGVLPGLGPVTGTVLLIPFTFDLPPATAILMLAGVYYGAMYGGSTTSILLNVPGESASVMTAVEGHRLARAGRAGPALAMSAIASFVAGTLAVVALMFLAPPLAQVALSFGPPEEFALLLAAFTILASLGGASVLKGLTMAALGVVLATIGLEPMVAQTRLSFGIPQIEQGISFVAATIGLFALPEVMEAMERPGRMIFAKTALRLRNFLPTLDDFRQSALSLPMGALCGFIGGIVPGAGATVSTFVTYDILRRISPRREQFGKGSIEAVAGVEGANNAASTGAMVPLLTFGIPGSGTTAVLMGAMMIHGLRPGPLLFETSPDVVWTLIASMYLGNLMLLILNLPLIGIWISALRIPGHVIMTAVLALSVVGVYAEENTLDNVWVMFCFGILGYVMKKLDFPPAPVVLALILTTPLEGALLRSLALSDGSFAIFFARPIALGLIIVAVLSVALQVPGIGRLFGLGRRQRWAG